MTGPRFTKLVSLSLVTVACLVLGTCVYNTWQAARLRANRNRCSNRLKLIGYALHGYHEQYGSFPPAYTLGEQNQRLHSWRTLILPFFDLPEENDTLRSLVLDKPWNEPPNVELSQWMPQDSGEGVYKCWLDPADPLSTSYLAAADSAAWKGAVPVNLDEIADPANTVMVVEHYGSGIHWMEPRDLPAEKRQGRSEHANGFYVLFADGHVGFLTTLKR